MKFTNLFISFTNVIYFTISQNDIDTKCWLLSCNYIKAFNEEKIYNCYKNKISYCALVAPTGLRNW